MTNLIKLVLALIVLCSCGGSNNKSPVPAKIQQEESTDYFDGLPMLSPQDAYEFLEGDWKMWDLTPGDCSRNPKNAKRREVSYAVASGDSIITYSNRDGCPGAIKWDREIKFTSGRRAVMLKFLNPQYLTRCPSSPELLRSVVVSQIIQIDASRKFARFTDIGIDRCNWVEISPTAF